MTLKKITLAAACLVMSCAFFSSNAFAAWAACTPKQIGPYGSFVRLQVINCNVNPAGSKSGWMTLSNTGTDQMMATILTAMSLKKPISIEYGVAGTDAQGYNIASAVIFNNQ
ncbi:MAG: hypothetical protein RBR09_13595 [Desulfobulbaceae bacterium]|jgi:hypothetical protein|nr:hypothetical protein [Desulfobulbaceae bacterium]